ncbi:hypothetical protein [Polyangium sorediatum]|uniref:Uncharacterized protein n=1 Tax=Polyangium sorediatum TaxID=889274 RepID=A0ABT6P7D4_9BACT|nr:hypothetical protein [Polyangium sorediatum]MDI1436085.1 hypothetical protein [Polyangium sorediatum]
MTVCPRCGARVTYVGVLTVECATRGCPNFREPPPAPPADTPPSKDPSTAEARTDKSPEDEELLASMLEGGFF